MKPVQFAFTLVFGLFVLLIGAFTILKGYRAVRDALEDTSSVLELARKMLSDAPLWATALVLVGLANLFSLLVWPWLQGQVASKAGLAGAEQGATNADPFPDWPVHELFFRLDPRILEEPHLANWEAIGRVLVDNLSIGRLQSWGRPYLGSLETTERNSTLVKIPADYWTKGGDLSYMFFSERYAGHTYPALLSDLPEYADMQLNKAQALGVVWPKLQASTLSLMEAATKAYEATQEGIAAGIAEREGGPDRTITWYCWAIWERTTLFGKRSPSTKLQKISRDCRNTHSFQVENGAVILKDRYSDARFDDLRIMADQMPSLIESIKGLG